MDSWFTTEPMLNILLLDIDDIGMVKQLKQRNIYCGKQYIFPQLMRFVRFEGSKNIFGSLVVTAKTGIPVKTGET